MLAKKNVNNKEKIIATDRIEKIIFSLFTNDINDKKTLIINGTIVIKI